MSKLAASHESSSDSVFEEMRDFFSENLRARDPEIDDALKGELARQQNQIELIASENIVSKAVLEAQGSVLTNKYAEGYPGARYYGGCEYMDVVESLAIERAKALFGCAFVNVQPHSGSQANLGAFAALLKPGDTVMGMSLDAGGHLSHGAAPNLSANGFAPSLMACRKRPLFSIWMRLRPLPKKRSRNSSLRADRLIQEQSISRAFAKSLMKWAPLCLWIWRILRGLWQPGFFRSASPRSYRHDDNP